MNTTLEDKTKENIVKLKKIKVQIIYINMDDSGVLHRNDKYCVYGGVAFVEKENRDKFIRQYKGILNGIKCNYCKKEKRNCDYKCPEIKHSNIYPNHKRRIYNLINKKSITFATIISNSKVNDNIINNKNSRGRFRDYCQRRIIKEVIQHMITKNMIDPNKPVELIIRIDQQGTTTDTGRAFVVDIQHELTDGIYNFKYDKIFPEILHSKLKIDLKYVISNKHVCIQASDLIAGKTRQIMLSNNNIKEKLDTFLDIYLLLP